MKTSCYPLHGEVEAVHQLVLAHEVVDGALIQAAVVLLMLLLLPILLSPAGVVDVDDAAAGLGHAAADLHRQLAEAAHDAAVVAVTAASYFYRSVATCITQDFELLSAKHTYKP